jgi:non-ribosomal peptide synthetase-like protein
MATTEKPPYLRQLPHSAPLPEVQERTLLELFADTVRSHPDTVAIDAPDALLNYEQLADEVTRLALELRQAGIGPGERVGVHLASGSSQLYVAILGVLHSGAAYVPVDVDDPPARAETIWEQGDVCAILDSEGGLTWRRPPNPCNRELAPEDDAWIIFTSGSTGQPKGVAVSHRSAAAFIDAEARLWNVSPQDRVLAGLSVAFDASCEEMWLAWSNGAALVPAPRELVRAGVDLGAWLKEQRISVVSTVPTLAAMWDQDALTGVRLLILGGEACPTELGWRLAGEREVWNTYGPTEATVVSTAARVIPGNTVTIGWPLHGWQVAVVDEHGQPVPLGDQGELVIAGVGLARYLDAQLDSERYAPLPALGWERAYRSGDVVRETIDGLQFIGRADDQVKLGGRRLELGEVEARLAAVAGVRAAAAAVKSTAAQNRILIGYVVGDVDPSFVRAQVAEFLPDGVTPLIVVLEELPSTTSGKVDRKALPWPPPGSSNGGEAALGPMEAWLAERLTEQLGPVAIAPESDLFELGASSTVVAKLVSTLRERFPALAVADVYEYRTVETLAARLEDLEEVGERQSTAQISPPRHLGAMQLAGVLVLTALAAIPLVIVVLAYGNIESGGVPHVGWGWLIGAWFALCSPPARLLTAVLARRLLLPKGLTPGRYPRDSWLTARVWFLERLGEQCRLVRVAGTPAAARWARAIGAQVADGARLGSMPALASVVRIEEGATIESDVDLHGWWIDGQELVVGEVHVGAGASVGSRTVLMGGASVGAGAEIEPGSVILADIPAAEHWGGNPACHLGAAGGDWPSEAPSPSPHRRLLRAMFSVGLAGEGILTLLAFVPAIVLLVLIGAPMPSLGGSPLQLLLEALVFVAVSTPILATLLALVLRLTWKLVRSGYSPGESALGWALWFSGDLQESTIGALFPLFASLYTRPWLRLAGIDIGKRTEISTSTGLNPMVSFGELSHATDDIAYCTARARHGWLRVQPITIGNRTFLGPGAILRDRTQLGDDSLLGALSLSPRDPEDGTSWFGVPALELPRVKETLDPARTTNPPRRLVAARAAMDTIRILLPNTLSVTIGVLDFLVLGQLGSDLGIAAMLALAPLVVLLSGLFSASLAVAMKWLVMGRYRPSRHPLWSSFVWRDELVNSAHEQLAGEWLLRFTIGSPLMSLYLRAMGARVGRGVWCETTAITEYDLIDLGDGAAVNRGACLMTHVFQDRQLSIGPTRIGEGATLGPTSAVLPDTELGDGACIGAHAVVLRGEHLHAGTRWQGSPVRSA